VRPLRKMAEKPPANLEAAAQANYQCYQNQGDCGGLPHGVNWANDEVSEGGGHQASEFANERRPPPFAQPKS